ncbi:MAG: hypothetical protein RDU24_08770 [Humidesulfovibrio sp.]|uniref:hypothetical protein n=1 Tax=Humidesulfovibrio sp. TaxID=2910988 RepID=UPI0027EDED0D|nr:hypothetical protein [Humidesulfovibrio sp.]MDQ7835460.1 hypothetical protein [Humidesulfovibrio sp.]
MAVNTTPIYAGVAIGNLVSFPAASSTTEADLTTVTAGVDQRIDSITIATDDTAVALCNLYLHDGTNDYQITNVPTAITAGSKSDGATPPTNVLGHANMAGIVQADIAGNKFLIIPAGWKLRAKFNAALTSGKTAWIQTRGWKFADA